MALPQDDPAFRLLTEQNAADKFADAAIDRKSTDFDFTAVSPSYFQTLNLADTSVMQSFVINEATNEIYATQVANGNPDATESYILSRLTMRGTLIDSMRLNHGGHGTTIGLETVGTDVYIWSNYDIADGSGANIGTKLVRYKYVPGAIYNENSPELVQYDKFTTSYVSIFTDQSTGLAAFRINAGSTNVVQLRRLADLKAGINNVLATINIPTNDPALNYVQGACIDGYDLYWYTGDTNSATYPAEITRFSFTTGNIVSRVTVDFGYGPDGTTYEDGFREPEGIHVYKDPKTGAKTLFAGVVTGRPGKRLAKVYGYHSLGNESKFLGDKLQGIQAFRLTEDNGKAFRLNPGATSLADYRTPGTFYITQAESVALTDHPLPNVGGWYLIVGAQDTAGSVWQTLKRVTASDVNKRTFERLVTGAGVANPFITTYSGVALSVPAGTTTTNAITAAGEYYLSGAEMSLLTNHPEPAATGGWFLEVSKPALTSATDRVQIFRRDTATKASMRIYEQGVYDTATASGWVLRHTGSPTWTTIPLDPAFTSAATPGVTLQPGGIKADLRGQFYLPAGGTYTAGMTVGTLPAGFIPSASRKLNLGVDDGAGGSVVIQLVTGTGLIRLWAPPVAGKFVVLDGNSYYL